MGFSEYPRQCQSGYWSKVTQSIPARLYIMIDDAQASGNISFTPRPDDPHEDALPKAYARDEACPRVLAPARTVKDLLIHILHDGFICHLRQPRRGLCLYRADHERSWCCGRFADGAARESQQILRLDGQ